MKRLIIVGGLLLCGVAGSQAWGQMQSQTPNGAPLKTMERARSYSLVNKSHETITAAHAQMTNGHGRDITWDQPVPPQQARNVAVPSQDCLARVTVTMQSGRTLNSGAATPDCRDTRIVVSDNDVTVGTNGSSASLSP